MIPEIIEQMRKELYDTKLCISDFEKYDLNTPTSFSRIWGHNYPAANFAFAIYHLRESKAIFRKITIYFNMLVNGKSHPFL